ncbi:unnamed protein product [Candidula unifasciata]|uniref:Uncharacterized protein n=1 Tax=Candidula unifasciata TaxID=100452 RepID=A0A8S3YVM1_9EUPU|nr:unnamed protein product [Candidula unifasciata]
MFPVVSNCNKKEMANSTPLVIPSFSLVLLAVLFLTTLPYSQSCPDTCFCIDAFVTCSDFRTLDMDLLPLGTDTLVLTRGEMDEIPPGFLAKAKDLRMLELSSVNAKVIKSMAFAGLSNLDLFSITSSSFDLVEPDSFNGLTDISKFHISDCRFGRVDKHAFSNINNIVDLRMWSSSFDAIYDEAFYKLTDTISFQLYQNNITSLGKELFLGASGVDDITIYKNIIQRVSEKCFDSLADATSRMVLHANVFMCTCDIAWILGSPSFKDYLTSNECIFPERSQEDVQKFRIADLTKKDLCPLWEESSDSTTESTKVMSSSAAISSSTGGIQRASVTLPTSSSSPLSTTIPQKSNHSFSTASKELTSRKSPSTSSHMASTLKPVTSEVDNKPSPDKLTTIEPKTADHTHTANVTGGHVHEGRTEASVDLAGDKETSKDGSSLADKTTFPDNASFRSVGNCILTTLLACFCISLRMNL